REMLVRQEGVRVSKPEDFAQKRRGDVALQEAVAVLGEHRGHPHWVVGLEADEPAVEQIVVELLHELPLTADGVEDLEQQGAQQVIDGRPSSEYSTAKRGDSAVRMGSTSFRRARSG